MCTLLIGQTRSKAGIFIYMIINLKKKKQHALTRDMTLARFTRKFGLILFSLHQYVTCTFEAIFLMESTGAIPLQSLNGNATNLDKSYDTNGEVRSAEASQRIYNQDDEKSTLIVNGKHLSPEATQRYLTSALVISWTSVIFSLATGLAAIVLSILGNSESLFAFGLDAVLDSLSSCAVIWRFQGNVDCVYSLARERKACIAIGLLFLVSSASLIIKSVVAIIQETHESKEVVLFDTFSLSCGVVSVFIGVAKVYVGLKLGSQALYTDSIITFVGAASCFAGVAGLELYVNNTEFWYLDSVFGVVCGLFLLLFGIRLLYVTLKGKN
ncbi:hypothetical protein Btru_075283 [Bulinus truncatus]|nr:hypothetical protein Btru_075283 [Bulinus truncatus]